MPGTVCYRAVCYRCQGGQWAAYIAGCLVVLRAECGFALPAGAGCRLHLHSEVPVGMGVSSSAAIEVASMQVRFIIISSLLTEIYVPRNCGCSSYSHSVHARSLCRHAATARQALAAAFDVDVESYRHAAPSGGEYPRGVKVALLCQRVENLVGDRSRFVFCFLFTP